MQMRTFSPTGHAGKPEKLAFFDDPAFVDLELAHVRVNREEPIAVIQDHGVPREEKALGQDHFSARRRANRRADLGSEIHSLMIALHYAVKDPSIAVLIRDE